MQLRRVCPQRFSDIESKSVEQMDWRIPLFKIYWDEEDIRMVKEAIQRGMFWAIGPNIENFEQMLAKYTGARYALVFNSGTSALHAVLLTYGIGQEDEIIVPSFTFKCPPFCRS